MQNRICIWSNKTGKNIGSIRVTVHLNTELNRNIMYGNNKKKVMQDNVCIGKKIRIINKSELKIKLKIRQGTDIGRKKRKTDNTCKYRIQKGTTSICV